uniref:Uncharacterized protein n=1 Tax=Timema poppense TaxID=170557 RepID=A0A7R9DJL1_TIMPO|nr:unnamed protein product [Timema poppensis]
MASLGLTDSSQLTSDSQHSGIYSSPMASLGLTDSSQLTSDSQHSGCGAAVPISTFHPTARCLGATCHRDFEMRFSGETAQVPWDCKDGDEEYYRRAALWKFPPFSTLTDQLLQISTARPGRSLVSGKNLGVFSSPGFGILRKSRGSRSGRPRTLLHEDLPSLIRSVSSVP